MDYIIEVNHVSKTYYGQTLKTRALIDCTFFVKAASFSCIIGKSGCGKSTLLNCLCGLIPIDSGSILFDGVDISKMKTRGLTKIRREKIGFVFQFFNLLQEQTVLENIMISFDINHEIPDMPFIEEIMGILEITDLKNKFPFELSGGEQQRVAIARALSRKPTLILADEPTGNLDTENTRQVMNLLKRCQALYSQTIIMVTHDLEIAKHADHILSMADGKVIPYEKK